VILLWALKDTPSNKGILKSLPGILSRSAELVAVPRPPKYAQKPRFYPFLQPDVINDMRGQIARVD
jgi:hypothetical protein